MRRRYTSFASALIVLVSVAGLRAQIHQPTASSRTVAIRCGRLIDGKSDAAISNAVVLIEGNRIKSVGANIPVPAGAEVIDLTGATVLPGLIDCHTHLLMNFDAGLEEDSNMLLTVAQMSIAKRAVKAGVPIAAGSDMYYQLPGKTRGHASLMMLRAYAEPGMTPMQIIKAATANAAQLLGWQFKVGSIEASRFADIIAVQGDPLKDITELERVRFVMKGGVIIKDELSRK